jgi:di/tricarboxylate transporter
LVFLSPTALQRRFASLRRKVVRALLVIGAVGVAIVLRLLPAEYRQQFAAKTAAVQEQQSVSIGQFLVLQGLFSLVALFAVPLLGKVAGDRSSKGPVVSERPTPLSTRLVHASLRGSATRVECWFT